MNKKKYILLIMVTATIVVVSMSSCADQKMVDIRYGGQFYAGEFLLKGNPKIWEDNSLSVEHIIFSSGTENNQALISGEIDINVGSDSKSVALFNAIPDDAVIIATIERGNRYSTIIGSDSTYESWYDLKGKIVGVRLGTGAEQVLLRYFDEIPDLDWLDFEWVDMKIEDMISALENGSIEAFTAWEPTPAVAEAQGVGKVLMSYGEIALTPVCMHTTLEFLNNNRENIINFLVSHLNKVEIIQNDPEKAAELAAIGASDLGIDVDKIAFYKIFQRVNSSMEINAVVIESLKDTAQFLYEKEKIDKIPSFRWDSSLLEEAKKRIE